LLGPPVVVTLTDARPAPAGETTVSDVGVLAVMVANRSPKLTALAFARLTPVIVTVVPPPMLP
jgi:hypothetical protein